MGNVGKIIIYPLGFVRRIYVFHCQRRATGDGQDVYFIYKKKGIGTYL